MFYNLVLEVFRKKFYYGAVAQVKFELRVGVLKTNAKYPFFILTKKYKMDLYYIDTALFTFLEIKVTIYI